MPVANIRIKKSADQPATSPVQRAGRPGPVLIFLAVFFVVSFAASFAFLPARSGVFMPVPRDEEPSRPLAAVVVTTGVSELPAAAEASARAKPDAPPVSAPVAVQPVQQEDNTYLKEVARRLQQTEPQLVAQLTDAPELTVTQNLSISWERHRHDLPARPRILPDDRARAVEKIALALRGRVSAERLQEEVSKFDSVVDEVTYCHTLSQLFETRRADQRQLLIDELSKHKTSSATRTLAERALYDPSSEVRARALAGLRYRPVESYRQVLLNGFRYPWPAVADHAAEALVSLKDSGSVPYLQDLLKERNPALPYVEGGEYRVRELVKVNHLCGCLLCHVPSVSTTEPLRGAIPIPGQPLPVLYYKSKPGNDFEFVDAGQILLRQDFSVMQTVTHLSPWPSRQRFDYLVRTRPATQAEIARSKALRSDDYPQRQAIRYALFHLSSKSTGQPAAKQPAKLVEIPRSN